MAHSASLLTGLSALRKLKELDLSSWAGQQTLSEAQLKDLAPPECEASAFAKETHAHSALLFHVLTRPQRASTAERKKYLFSDLTCLAPVKATLRSSSVRGCGAASLKPVDLLPFLRELPQLTELVIIRSFAPFDAATVAFLVPPPDLLPSLQSFRCKPPSGS